jgi:predicted AAA+ superfamily ATPase
MLAAVHGQPLNASQLGASLGLDHKTVLRYCDHLEGAYLVRRLPPYFTNTKKRLVKTPRLYWRDSGLLHALQDVETLDQLYRQPWVGASWEGFVIEQTLATLSASGLRARASFFRSSDGYEADLVLEVGGETWALEIKLTSNPTSTMIDRLQKSADLIRATRRFLVCRIARRIQTDSLLVAGPSVWLRELRALASE